MGLRTLLGLKRPKPKRVPDSSNPRWKDLKTRAFGMLPPAVYEKIYHTAFRGPDLDIVEIGGAAGAASIAAALGLKESGKSSRVIVVEKLQGGSRSGNSYETNLDIFRRNVSAFDVEAQIELFPHHVTPETVDQLKALIRTKLISALVLDADGRIDRDFRAFWNMVVPGGHIVIDDYKNDVSRFKPVTERHPTGGAKMPVAFRLTNYMIELGLFAPNFQINSTLFGTKPLDGDISRLDQSECDAIIATVHRERDEALRAAS
jgi:predicted O-methyltransferase YrrM